MTELRARLDRSPVAVLVYRVIVGVVGTVVLVAGVVMLPAPGPGWLVIFAGLGILSTEFAVARRLLVQVRDRYQAWVDWIQRQHPLTRAAVLLGLLVLVVAGVWLVGGVDLVAGWVGIDPPWPRSPLAR